MISHSIDRWYNRTFWYRRYKSLTIICTQQAYILERNTAFNQPKSVKKIWWPGRKNPTMVGRPLTKVIGRRRCSKWAINGRQLVDQSRSTTFVYCRPLLVDQSRPTIQYFNVLLHFGLLTTIWVTLFIVNQWSSIWSVDFGQPMIVDQSRPFLVESGRLICRLFSNFWNYWIDGWNLCSRPSKLPYQIM